MLPISETLLKTLNVRLFMRYVVAEGIFFRNMKFLSLQQHFLIISHCKTLGQIVFFKVNRYTFAIFIHFYKGANDCDFLFASIEDKTLTKWVYFYSRRNWWLLSYALKERNSQTD